MVPTFEKFLLPVLDVLKDQQEHNFRNLMEIMASRFGLTVEDLAETVKSGAETKFHNRVSWATSYLSKADLLERPKKGVYKITPMGLTLLQELERAHISELSTKFLAERYPKFFEFVNAGKEKTSKPDDSTPAHDKTPIERMDEAFDEINSTLANDLLEQVKTQSPQFFERMVVKLLVAMGYGGSLEEAGMVTKFSHDEGIDGIIKEDKLGLDAIYIQAKRFDKGQVGRPEIQKFVGALSGQGASKGIFITTSTFTKEAMDYKTKVSGVKIVLVDGTQLANFMIENNIGVSVKQTYTIKRIDTDFFDEE